MKAHQYSLLFFTLATLFFDVAAMPPTVSAVKQIHSVEGAWSTVEENNDKTGTLEEIVVFKKEGDYKFEKVLNLSTEKNIQAETAEGNYGLFHKKLALSFPNETDECKAQKCESVWIRPKEYPDVILILTLMDDWKKKIFKVLSSENPDISYETWDQYVSKTEAKALDFRDEGNTLLFNLSSSSSVQDEYKKTDSVQIADIQGLKFEIEQDFRNKLEPSYVYRDD